jgi:hypothetical protein
LRIFVSGCPHESHSRKDSALSRKGRRTIRRKDSIAGLSPQQGQFQWAKLISKTEKSHLPDLDDGREPLKMGTKTIAYMEKIS